MTGCIKWKKLDSGEYESEDGRFHIIRSWDRMYGNHWELHDRHEENYYQGMDIEKTLTDCKVRAEMKERN